MLTFNKLKTYLPLAAAICLLIFPFKDSLAQGRDRSKFKIFGDTTIVSTDTTKVIDSSLVRLPVDSTARIKNYKYVRKDSPIPNFGNYTSPLIFTRSARIEYRMAFDSLDNVVITEKFNGENIKVPLVIPFEKYLEVRTKKENRDNLYKLVAEFYKIETQDDLEKLFKNITDITIPLPFKTETIFGPPTIKLQINGLIDITASYQKTKVDQQTISTTDQTQNNINFKQDVQVTTKGSVGDKLTIDADWNSQRTFDYENQLKLKYTGYPDEVIKSIEAGNVSLETKSNLIGSTQALFGVKGVFKLGPLTLTGIASQKKSEKKEIDVTGGSREVQFGNSDQGLNIKDYSDNHFFLDTLYQSKFEEYYARGNLTTNDQDIDVQNIEVWAQTTTTNPNKRKAVGWVQLYSKSPNGVYPDSIRNQDIQIPGHKMVGYFYKLSATDYTVQAHAGYITINISAQQNNLDAVGVAYRLANNQNVQFGTFANEVSTDSLVLKIVRINGLKPPSQDTNFTTAWKLKLKNIYEVGVKNLQNDPSKFNCEVVYKPPSTDAVPNYNGKTFLNIVRLDLRQNGGTYDTNFISPHPITGDGQFDFFPNYTVDLVNGYIIFPTLQPFLTTLRSAGVNDSLFMQDTNVYYGSKEEANANLPKFYIRGKATGDATDRYQLGFNVVENSVKVFNGGVQLTAGIDYTVDYSTGEVVITNRAALTQGSSIKISYETNDLFQLASKTLLGTRAEFQINKTSYIGFTLVNLKQQTLNDKVRIGEEPTNNTIIGFDAASDIKLPFVSKLFNKLPGYNTKEESILNLKGEVAFMIPDPNTKKSKIPSDNNEPVAYLDDFEGSKKIVSLGISPTAWTLGSLPDQTEFNNKSDSLIGIKRFKMNWFTNLNDPVLISDVFPNRSVASNQNKTLNPMVVNLYPDLPGQYTYINNANFLSNEPDRQKRWAGIFKYLNTSSTNLIDENINFIEVWMQINYNESSHPVNDSAKMVIDLGTISEKIIYSQRVPYVDTAGGRNFHSEDKNNSGFLNEGEDNGIDGLTNAEELSIFGDIYSNSDPSGDDYQWTQGSLDFNKFNGTQGNAQLDAGRKIDTEDLNGDGTLNTVNSYLSYEVPLKPDTTTNKYITGGGNKGWYQFSVPLSDFKKMIGATNPITVLTNIQFARMWFKGLDSNATVRIVDFNLVGNQWQKSNKNDTSFSVSSINIEDNSDIYQSPVPGDVLRQRDQTSSDPNALSNEGSLALTVRDLYQGTGKYVKKLYSARPLDLLNYKVLKFFVNGDPRFSYTNENNYDAAVVVRFGTDSSNYYEYRAPIHPDVRPGSPWNSLNEVVINLSDLATVKELRDSVNTIRYVEVINGQPGAQYGVIGNPTLTGITQILLGIENRRNGIVGLPISGQVWFDEMRVLKTNDKSGYAFTLNADLKMADFGTLNFAYQKTDPNFHNLESRFGTRELKNYWQLSGTLNFHKILNSLLSSLVSVKFKDFFTIPISFSHTETYNQPKYLPSSDIEMEAAVQSKYDQVLLQTGNPELAQYQADKLKISTQSLDVQNTFSINGFKLNFPSENYIIREIVNKIQLNVSYNSTTRRTSTSQSYNAWDLRANLSLNLNNDLSKIVNLKLGKLLPFLGNDYKDAKLYFFFPFIGLAPLFSSGLNLTTDFNRSRTNEQLRSQSSPNPTNRNFNANRGFGLDWKFIENWIVDIGGSYSFGAASDLTYLETTNDSLRQQRETGQIIDDIFGGNEKLINFGRDQTLQQTVNINPKFNIPVIKNFLDITASYTGTYRWRPPQLGSGLGNAVENRADLQTSVYFRLKQIFDLFKSKNPNKIEGGSKTQDEPQSFGNIIKLLGTFLPDQVSMTYSQAKSNFNLGVDGRAGFQNFWVNYGNKDASGPSRLYQLGWSNNPGKRLGGLNFTDLLSYSNNLSFNTTINPIFPDNLKLTLTYRTSWSNNNSYNYTTNQFGDLGTPNSFQSNRIISRPTFLFGTDLIQKIGVTSSTNTQEVTKFISDAFEKNFVSFPFPNWTLTLNGVEKFEMFSNFVSAMSVENAFTSEYKRNFINNGIQPEYISTHNVTSGFSPLIGVNITFKQIEGGNLTASFKINKTNNFDLTTADNRVNFTSTNDLSINAGYSKSGFKLPLFGLSLNNDITISFSYTRTKNDPRTLRYNIPTGSWENTALNGTVSTTLNPSIQYALSKNVTMQLFYKFTKTEATEGTQAVPTRTSNEAGLNIKLSIQ